MKIRTLAAAGAALAATAAIVPGVADAQSGNGGNSRVTYTITVENLTDGQPLSPFGTVVHTPRVDVWSTGQPASAAVAAIAEDANLPVFVDTYDQVRGVRSSEVGGAGPIGPGASTSFEITAKRGERLSLVGMLVNTNDAFTGLDSVRLGNRTKVIEVDAYDAGTEVNNELASHIPGPVGGNPFVREPEGGVIAPHEGITGQPGGIDPMVYDWDDPVARITIERAG